jgi:hypothetical protein
MNLVKGEGLRVKGGTPGAIHTLPPSPFTRPEVANEA